MTRMDWLEGVTRVVEYGMLDYQAGSMELDRRWWDAAFFTLPLPDNTALDAATLLGP